jgi:hypothetical protein
MKVVLEIERLLLRYFTEADAEFLLHMEMEPDVLRYVGRKPLADVDAYRNNDFQRPPVRRGENGLNVMSHAKTIRHLLTEHLRASQNPKLRHLSAKAA